MADAVVKVWEPGIYPDVKKEEYFAIEAMSQSCLWDYTRSPAHWKAEQLKPREPTADMNLGNVIDCAILEPHFFDSRYVVMPDLTAGCKNADGSPSKSPKSTGDYKKKVAAFQLANIGKETVEQAWIESARGISEAIAANETAAEILGGDGQNQVAIVWRDPETGILCKGLLDRVCQFQGQTAIVDLKTTADVRFFEKTCGDFGYAFQAAYYLHGLSVLGQPASRFLHVVCERDAPYAVEVRELDDESLDQGIRDFTECLAMHKKCLASGHWPTKRSGIIPCRLPKYKFNQIGLES